MSSNSEIVNNEGEPFDEEMTIPRAALNKMIREVLPNVRVGNDARELILQCCSEFIHLLASESNEICNLQQKKTISADHILASLEKLGFGDYCADAERVLKDCKAVAARKRLKNTRLENLGIPEEELFRQQQELFAKARQEQLLVENQMLQEVSSQFSCKQELADVKVEDFDEDIS